MLILLQNSINGVVWYILGVNFALSFYPQDVATVAILMFVYFASHFKYSSHRLIPAFPGQTRPPLPSAVFSAHALRNCPPGSHSSGFHWLHANP